VFFNALAGFPSLLLLEAASVSTGARVVLFCLIGLLLIILGVLIAFAWTLRKRPAGKQGRAPVVEVVDAEALERLEADGTLASINEGEAARSVTAVCPTCQREFDGSLQYCPRDARRLVPVAEIVQTRKRTGRMCPTCKRGFDRGVRYCPHDATELLPGAAYAAAEEDETSAPSGSVMAKICPRCRSRHELSATFCSRDGSELVVLN